MLVTNIVGFLILTLHAAAFSENNFQSSSIQFTNDVLITHVTLTIISYGFFYIIIYLFFRLFSKLSFDKKKETVKMG